MNKKILVLFLLFFMTGCWNYHELNSIAISTALAIDKKDDEYEISILIANSKKGQVSAEKGESQTVVYSAKGNTISDALKNIDLENPRQTYIGHLAVIVISEEVAKEGLMDILDLLLRNSESTKRFYIAIATDYSAKDIIQIISPLETFPSQTISINIKSSSESQAVSAAVTYSKFIETLLKKGVNPLLPTITIEGDEKKGSDDKNLEKSSPSAILKLGTLTIFDDDKLIGSASKNESRGINLMMNQINEMIIEDKCGDNYLVASLSQVSSKTSIEFKNGKPIATISIKGIGDITENSCNLELTDPKVIDKIEKEINDKMESLMKKGLKLIQNDLKSDVIGIGNLVYKKNPKYYKKIKDWDQDIFPDMKIKVKSNINISTKGSTKQSIKEAKNEN